MLGHIVNRHHKNNKLVGINSGSAFHYKIGIQTRILGTMTHSQAKFSNKLYSKFIILKELLL